MSEPWPPTPAPPTPFDPEVVEISPGAEFYRVHSNRYGPTQFNGSGRGGGRFHFFGDPLVPVLYMAGKPETALAETLLHDLPVGVPSRLARDQYEDTVMSKIRVRRPLRVAVFHGFGLRRLGVTATQLTDTPTSRYPRTRRWAEAAHQHQIDEEGRPSELDGVVWMSRQLNSDHSYMLFGDRVTEAELEVVPGAGLVFASGPGFNWMVTVCAPLRIDVAPK